MSSFITSWIPTTAVAVTRAADAASIPTDASWFNANFGTLQAEFIYTGQLTGGFGCVIALGNGTSGTFIEQYLQQGPNSLAAYSKNNDVLVCTAGVSGSVVPGAVTKSANSYQSMSMSAALSGSVGGAGAVTGALPLITQLGFMPLGVNYQAAITGYMRRVSYWNRPLSDAEMQQVTT